MDDPNWGYSLTNLDILPILTIIRITYSSKAMTEESKPSGSDRETRAQIETLAREKMAEVPSRAIRGKARNGLVVRAAQRSVTRRRQSPFFRAVGSSGLPGWGRQQGW